MKLANVDSTAEP